MELAFLSAVEQARLIRAGEASSVELVAAVPRTDRADRSRAERVRDRLRRRGARSGGSGGLDTRRRTLPRSSDRHQGPRRDRGHPDDVLVARLRRLRPGLRHGRRAPNPRRGIRDRRKDEHARVRHRRVHGVRPQRRDSQPLEHRPHARRIERRCGGGRFRRSRADRPCDGRRRLDPHPGVVLRPLRSEAVARTRLERAVRLPRGPLDRRADGTNGRGRGALPRRPRRLRARRSVVGSSTRAAVRGDDRRSRLLLSASR